MPEFGNDNNTDWIIKQIGEPSITSQIDNGIENKLIEIRYAMFPQKSGKLKTPELIFNGYYIDSIDTFINDEINYILNKKQWI